MPRAAVKKTAASPSVPLDTSVPPVLYNQPASRPDSFKALRGADLIAAAREFGSEDEGTDEVLRADLEAMGVTWSDYVVRFKLPGWEDLVEHQEQVEAGFVEPPELEEVPVISRVDEIITASPIIQLPEGKYLVKFVGENWYFERGAYKFTKENPYAMMNARAAQDALVDEPTKFRQAYPAEVEEYYS